MFLRIVLNHTLLAVTSLYPIEYFPCETLSHFSAGRVLKSEA